MSKTAVPKFNACLHVGATATRHSWLHRISWNRDSNAFQTGTCRFLLGVKGVAEVRHLLRGGIIGGLTLSPSQTRSHVGTQRDRRSARAKCKETGTRICQKWKHASH